MIAPVPIRIKIFVDFWNYELSMKAVDVSFRTDWMRLPREITAGAGELLAPPHGVLYHGMHVYGSYDPTSDRDAPLHRWATTVLSRFAGTYVEFVPRQKKKTGPICPGCRGEIRVCPACDASLLGSGEKGVDTRIATDMVRYAWEDAYDAAVLVSSDRDFEPVATFLSAKGKIIIHGAFPPNGAVVSRACWGSISIPALRARFQR